MTYTGWLLSGADRARLLGDFPPSYPDVIAHHVTLRMGAHELPTATAGTVVGVVDDQEGCQVLIVQIDGTTTRPDGLTFHITWSLDRALDRKSMHSNDVIMEHGWTAVWPIDIKLIPAVME